MFVLNFVIWAVQCVPVQAACGVKLSVDISTVRLKLMYELYCTL